MLGGIGVQKEINIYRLGDFKRYKRIYFFIQKRRVEMKKDNLIVGASGVGKIV